jgi:hypothetical protein
MGFTNPKHREGVTMGRRIRASAALLGAVAVVLGVFSTPASSAPAEEENCITAIDKEEATVECFATFTEAVRVATGGSVTDAPATAAEALRDDAFMRRIGFNLEKTAQPPALLRYPIGIEYDGVNWTGPALLAHAPRPCTNTIADVDYYATDMPWLWDDRVSSFKNANNCWTNHYRLALFRSTNTGYLNDRLVMPAPLNNHTRSIRWS